MQPALNAATHLGLQRPQPCPNKSAVATTNQTQRKPIDVTAKPHSSARISRAGETIRCKSKSYSRKQLEKSAAI